MSNPFLVTSLVPEGQQERTYQLTADSVSPTRMRLVKIGDDEMEVEETLMTLAKSERFVDNDGNICDVALRTGRVPSQEPEAIRYEQVVIHDIVRAGQMPLRCCPATSEFKHLLGRALIVNAKYEDCGGNPEGCKHMKAEIEARRAKARTKFEKAQSQLAMMKREDVESMMAVMAKTFNQTITDNAVAAGRNALRSDKSEK